MENVIQDIHETPYLTDKDVWIKIWTSPREVFKFINQFEYEKHLRTLILLAGISNAFGRASGRNLGDTMSVSGIIIVCLLGGAIFNWITFYIYAALISWTGGFLKAKGGIDSILRVLAYGSIPIVISLSLIFIQIAVYGNEIFKSNGDLTSGGLVANIIFWLSLLIEFILNIWAIVLFVIGISEVQDLSIGKSILNLLLPVIVIFAVLLILIYILKL